MKSSKIVFNIIILFATLFGTWYSFSGFDSAFFLSLAAISCAIAVFIGWKMNLIEKEIYPSYLRWKSPFYFLWLTKEMFISSISVSLKIWLPNAKISPTLGWIKSTQSNSNGRAVYGNSITLTPGTVCTDIKGKDLQIHALTLDGFEELQKGVMGKKITESIG